VSTGRSIPFSVTNSIHPGSPEFFDQLDDLKRNDIERFSQPYWSFERFHGKNVLDVGCGPGWLTVKYAEAGAHVWSIDLTPRAVELARRFLALRGLSAVVKEANAEESPVRRRSVRSGRIVRRDPPHGRHPRRSA
jgi:2-polyprenyl-3-methyl-5-hydroxy-6-metoxy-1,4-benzoquinol methylase